ncbi:MAG: GDYXXLXY domain-containing protein [Roseibium sp.]|nr:GDYXXLXY domain-containing protein [Roseibium sp.]
MTAAVSPHPAMRRPVPRSKAYLLWGLVALLQLGLIAVPLIDRLQVQMTGEEVTLELMPIDPRDLLRGDYVIVNPAIRTLPDTLPGAEGSIAPGETIYVGLSAGPDGIARPQAVSRDRDRLGPLAIAGQVVDRTSADLRIDYGIDAFFLTEGAGKEIEALPADRVRLVIALTEDGRSLPLRLLVDGVPVKSDGAF